MKLNDKIYCDVCCKRIDNYTEPADFITYNIKNQERHYCKKHNNIGEKLYKICITNEDVNTLDIHNTNIFTQPKIPPMPPVKPPKKEKIRRIYEDDNFVVDLFVEDNTLRVSIFKDGHYKDEVIIKKSNYIY